MTVFRINHVQIAMPRGREAEARAFFGDVLGLPELPKPAALAARGGVWFDLGDAQLHLGVDMDFRPSTKAHVAFELEDLEPVVARCAAAGVPAPFDVAIPGVRRCFVADPFGNRLELMEIPRTNSRSVTPRSEEAAS
jgi:catechol 2,3-dioxygenase-like lactoylglutathione lyase family enzyme